MLDHRIYLVDERHCNDSISSKYFISTFCLKNIESLESVDFLELLFGPVFSSKIYFLLRTFALLQLEWDPKKIRQEKKDKDQQNQVKLRLDRA